MSDINFFATRNERIEWVQAQIAGIFDLEYHTDRYDSPEKWEDTITSAMHTAARDEDAKRISSDITEHVRQALADLEMVL